MQLQRSALYLEFVWTSRSDHSAVCGHPLGRRQETERDERPDSYQPAHGEEDGDVKECEAHLFSGIQYAFVHPVMVPDRKRCAAPTDSRSHHADPYRLALVRSHHNGRV